MVGFYFREEIRNIQTNTFKFQIMMTYCLHRRLKDTNISVFSLHPGAVETPVLKDFEEKTGAAGKLGVKFYRMIGRFFCEFILLALIQQSSLTRGFCFRQQSVIPEISEQN